MMTVEVAYMKSDDIYGICKNLGLSKVDVGNVLSTKENKFDSPSADIYKVGNKYGTVSRADLYKDGSFYGSISIKDF